jgi:hypothetical protein
MWVSKLFRYDLTVEYRPSKLNGVANVLSRRTEEAAAVHAISTLTFELFDKLQSESAPDPQVADVHAKLIAGEAKEGWSMQDEFLLFRGNIFVGVFSIGK